MSAPNSSFTPVPGPNSSAATVGTEDTAWVSSVLSSGVLLSLYSTELLDWVNEFETLSPTSGWALAAVPKATSRARMPTEPKFLNLIIVTISIVFVSVPVPLAIMPSHGTNTYEERAHCSVYHKPRKGIFV